MDEFSADEEEESSEEAVVEVAKPAQKTIKPVAPVPVVTKQEPVA